jgi:predicted nucleic acid-binding protein
VILYLDTSALVKVFIDEESSGLVRELVGSADVVATSRIAYAEACSALARRRREKALGAKDFQTARLELRRQWNAFAVLELDEFKAGDLATEYPLRGLDAIHLAAALEIQSRGGDVPLVFCSFDALQAEAARSLELKVVPEDIGKAVPRVRGAPRPGRRSPRPPLPGGEGAR